MGKSTPERNYDRCEAVRLIADLLGIDGSMRDGLLALFKRLDDDETVKIDGLEKRVRKKIRHLFQALKFVETETKSWKRPKKVKVKKEFKELLTEAESWAKEAERKESETPVTVSTVPANVPATGISDDGRSQVKGPIRPTPEMLAAAAKQVPREDSDEEVSAGPLPMDASSDAYATRRKDLDELKSTDCVREEWMLTPGERLKGCFEDPHAATKNKEDRFAVKRTREEEEAFEQAFKDRGSSLMDQVQSGKFNGNDLRAVRAKYDPANSSADLWGMNSREQAIAGTRNQSGVRRAFDPERDMEMRRSMSHDGFHKLVDEAKSMNDRFQRSEVATSFL